LLLDEPFSALDAAARESLGDVLADLGRAAGVPFLHVTHDLGEALRLGDRLVLLEAGRVLQVGPPDAVVARPASLEAARVVGTGNLFRGTILTSHAASGCTEVDLGGTRVLVGGLDEPPGSSVALGLRAEEALLSLEPLAATSARNVLPGTVRELTSRGTVVEVRIETPVSFRVMVTPASVSELALAPGREVHLLIKATAFHRLA
ncbi:MAG: TOBE domain-containing protein, partial [Gammaproteobacteria bacterium]|nr:TOBE domain-containing protein [Gammaproteobacteria bacterium]